MCKSWLGEGEDEESLLLVEQAPMLFVWNKFF